MAEGFREWGEYGKEEEWRSRPPIKKVFSFRTLKKILKIICIVLISAVYLVLGYRLITGLGVPGAATKLVWLDNTKAAYNAEGGDLSVYAQTPEATFGEDGRFSIYQMKFIPEISQLQLTIRYNRSTVAALKSSIEKKYAAPEGATAEEKAEAQAKTEEALSMIDDAPFAFILRDDAGKVYTKYSMTSFKKGLYTYVRLVYDDVELFNTETAPRDSGYFSPDEKYSDIIYKGANKSVAMSSDISYLYIDFYYENDVKYDSESWADPLLVYRSGLELTEYDVKKDPPEKAKNGDVRYFDVAQTD